MRRAARNSGVSGPERHRWAGIALAMACAWPAVQADAQPKPAEAAKVEPGQVGPGQVGPGQVGATRVEPSRSEANQAGPIKAEEARTAQYCAGISSAAADARFTWQKEALDGLAKDLEARIGQLEAKRAAYEMWLKRRQAFLAKADESVTAIYAKMRPEAASQQLTAMDTEAAAAILTRLDPRIAGAIMNEMEPGRAARLANVITNTPKKPVPPGSDETVKAPSEPRTDEGGRSPQDSETSG